MGICICAHAKARQQLPSITADSVLPLKGILRQVKDSVPLLRYLDKKQHNAFMLLNDSTISLKRYLNTPLQHAMQGAETRMIYEDGPATQGIRWVVNASDQVSIAQLPFGISYTNLATFGDADYLRGGIFKIAFDHDMYVQQLNAKLNEWYDLKKYFLKEIDGEALVKAYVDQRMKSMQAGMDSLYGIPAAAIVPGGISTDQLIRLDSQQLRNLFADNNYVVLPKGADTIVGMVDKVKAARAAYMDKLLQLKGALNSGAPLKEQLARYDKIKEQASKWMMEEDNKIEGIEKLMPLSGIQRLFLHMKTLNLGSFHTASSPMAISGLFMNGAAGSYLSKGKLLMAGVGSRADGRGMRNAMFNESLSANHYAMQYIGAGKGTLDKPHTHVTFLNASSRNNNTRQLSQSFLSRNTFVGTVSKQIRLGEYGSLNGEFSKSANQFSQATAGNNGYTVSNKAAAMSFLNDFWQTISVGINYMGSFDKAGLSHKAYFTFAGMGYNNPGAPNGLRGSWQYGLNVRKKWKQAGLITGLKADMKDMSTSFSGGWKNRQYSADVSWRLKRNWYLSSKLMQSSLKSSNSDKSTSSFLTRQFTASSQLSSKVAGLPTSNTVVFGLQQINLASGDVRTNSMLVNTSLMQAVMVGGNTLSMNVFYNYDLKQNALYSNLLNADMSWNYTVRKMITCSSGITYLDNRNVVRQIGVKQMISAALLPKLNCSLYIDSRKNLLNTERNYLFGTFRSEVAIQYLIN
ncbi:hypothetical protein L3C95_26235 [Chitinophaga filiformis]|uniref:hypothetical protein n=1 Tax=Chitinophaga filiformis TaxID=104663 RepID=UPI001F37DD91|nr:hypothetical protein [Chitinophaga filiformis]MCF6406422.1 hypothetical protein [Chitinophaga filiformis]